MSHQEIRTGWENQEHQSDVMTHGIDKTVFVVQNLPCTGETKRVTIRLSHIIMRQLTAKSMVLVKVHRMIFLFDFVAYKMKRNKINERFP
jgi:hypothetical protein